MKISRPWDFVLILVAVLALIGAIYLCTSEQASQSRITNASYEIPHALIPPGDERNPDFEMDRTDANNRFALDFYRTLRSSSMYSGSNIIFSPYSISSAFAITCEGARGKTKDEIRSVFAFPKNDTARRLGYAGVCDELNNANASYTLRTATALWAEKTHPFLPDYVRTAGQYYGANTTNLDLSGQPEESAAIINRWIEYQTENRIKNLVSTSDVSPAILVITNAIYFKGDWGTPFTKDATTPEVFQVSSGKSVTTPMMHRDSLDELLPYGETDTFQVLELPYQHGAGKKLSMIIILPKGENINVVEDHLDLQQIATIRGTLVPHRVIVSLPKFSLGTTYNLAGPLRDMGMPTAFGSGADFSGMDGTGGSYIGTAVHKVFVEVNEEGTVAAAATAVAVWEVSTRQTPVTFRAGHPFIFLIQDTESGNILFMGRVVDPSAM